MRKMVLAALGAAALTGAMATTTVAWAQPAGDTLRMAQREHRLPGERIEARLAYAKAALKITPAQESQWNTLAEVLRRHARAMDEQITKRRAESNQPTSAIDRLQRRQELMTAAAARMNEVLEAAKPLYASLDDDQKKEADALLSRGGHHRGHGMRWH